MPLKRGSSGQTIAGNIAELHGGRVYARTAARHGKAAANRQAVAIAMKEAGKSRAGKGARKAMGRRRTIAEGY